ncbi:TM9S3-like protein [Mya arenaria]|uniref:Transmembrane 9 superfamily member n=1 Tax=Mya arenaria TaxID=6604 RepID=A0ABY7DE05_MYAAR|nr:TM9S3-like protein [Mya arenaria]
MKFNYSTLICILFLLVNLGNADEHNHVYEDAEEVVLWMNTVGPYHNRQETYSYFSLPFCEGPKKDISHYHETLGEALQGTELEFSGLDIDFKSEQTQVKYCEIKLTEEKYQAFVYAVRNHYWYQMYIDDLPIWGIVGEIGENKEYYVWTHKKFDIGYNSKQIVDVNLTSDAKVKLEVGAEISFSYEIHWFSIFNSFMMVIFLEKDLGDEYGWKQVHGDVFRPATQPMFFSALIGTGYHITTVTLCVILRGSLLSTSIFVYAATSPVNGYFGGSLYARMGAIYYHASRAIPFGTMVAVTCICIFVILPLNLVGTVLGRNLAGQPDYPCRVNAVPRPIPEKKWFMEPSVIIVLGGILPFGSIFIEMYFIFTSFWAYKIYYVYGFMLLVFLILAVVTVCVTIVCTYFLLNAEDYRWQWTSFLSAASTAGYVYIYSFYYFFFKTKNSWLPRHQFICKKNLLNCENRLKHHNDIISYVIANCPEEARQNLVLNIYRHENAPNLVMEVLQDAQLVVTLPSSVTRSAFIKCVKA